MREEAPENRGLDESTTWGFSGIIENIDVGILVLDLENRKIEYRNPVFYQVLGEDEFCGDFDALYKLLLQDIELTQEKPEFGSIPWYISLNDKKIGCSVYRITDRYLCVFIRDITEKRRFENIAQAVNSMDSLGFIFSGIRHEIGNPLNSLKITLSVLKQNLDHFPAKTVADYIERCMEDINRVEYLLKSLKSFSIFEHVDLADIPFGLFMDSFMPLAERDLQQRGIAIEIESTWHSTSIRIDQRAMHQVLLNILANAADSLEDCLTPQITVSTRLHDHLLWLTISDNGCGISLEQQKYLFQPFNSSKPNGNGLGLVIARKLLALMDSSIDIESHPGKGTEVTISLPTSEISINPSVEEEV